MRSDAEEQAAAVLRQGKRVLITSHPHPDGDAVGSMLAAMHALRAMEHDLYLFNPDPVPRHLTFLEDADLIRSALPAEPFDVTLVVDCSDPRMFRSGMPAKDWLGKVVVVDHHKTPGSLGDIVVRDETAASVGVMLYRLFQQMKVAISKPMAEALYCSLISDTGSFRFQNTNAEALRMAAELLELGVDPWRVAFHLFETRSRAQLDLLALALPTLVVSEDGRAACIAVTQEMLDTTGATTEMVDNFVSYARGLEGVEVGILLRPGTLAECDGERQQQPVRVSLRSRGNVDAAAIAERMGGGGHRNAAGLTSYSEMAAVRDALFEAVSRQMEDT